MGRAKGVTSFSKNEVNPFLMETETHIKLESKEIIVGNQDGEFMVNSKREYLGKTIFAKRQVVDTTQFAKIYLSSVPAFFNLSKSGIRLFGYVLKVVKPNSDHFYFELDECMEITGYKSDKSVWKGISELLEFKFIARSKKSYKYYINPTIFFNGDRKKLTFVHQYEIEDIAQHEVEYSDEEVAGVLERNKDLRERKAIKEKKNKQ